MHACLTAAVINHCLEDYWRNVLVWAHSLVYLTGCSELQCKMNRHRCTASQHRAILYQESIFWLLTALLCVLGYLLSRVCSSDLHRMWGPLEFESAINSHNEKLFKLSAAHYPGWPFTGSTQLLLQISGPATRGATGNKRSFWCCWNTSWWHQYTSITVSHRYFLFASISTTMCEYGPQASSLKMPVCWSFSAFDSKSKDPIHYYSTSAEELWGWRSTLWDVWIQQEEFFKRRRICRGANESCGGLRWGGSPVFSAGENSSCRILKTLEPI